MFVCVRLADNHLLFGYIVEVERGILYNLWDPLKESLLMKVLQICIALSIGLSLCAYAGAQEGKTHKTPTPEAKPASPAANTLNNAGKTIGKELNSAGQAISNTVHEAASHKEPAAKGGKPFGAQVNNAKDVVGKELNSAGQAISNTVHGAAAHKGEAANTAKSLGNQMNNAGKVVGKELNSAGQALSNTMHEAASHKTPAGKDGEILWGTS